MVQQPLKVQRTLRLHPSTGGDEVDPSHEIVKPEGYDESRTTNTMPSSFHEYLDDVTFKVPTYSEAKNCHPKGLSQTDYNGMINDSKGQLLNHIEDYMSQYEGKKLVVTAKGAEAYKLLDVVEGDTFEFMGFDGSISVDQVTLSDTDGSVWYTGSVKVTMNTYPPLFTEKREELLAQVPVWMRDYYNPGYTPGVFVGSWTYTYGGADYEYNKDVFKIDADPIKQMIDNGYVTLE